MTPVTPNTEDEKGNTDMVWLESKRRRALIDDIAAELAYPRPVNDSDEHRARTMVDRTIVYFDSVEPETAQLIREGSKSWWNAFDPKDGATWPPEGSQMYWIAYRPTAEHDVKVVAQYWRDGVVGAWFRATHWMPMETPSVPATDEAKP